LLKPGDAIGHAASHNDQRYPYHRKIVWMNKRETAKLARKSDILFAAKSLLDEEGLSMRALAVEANVSLKTPYNLFGSKQDLLASLMDADLKSYQVQVEDLRSTDSIQKIFDALELAMVFFQREEKFYRGLFLATMNSEGKSMLPIFLKPRIMFWTELISAGICEKKIKKEIDPAIVSKNITNLFSGSLHEWALGLITTETMHYEVGYGIASLVYPTVKNSERKRILNKIVDFQKLMQASR